MSLNWNLGKIKNLNEVCRFTATEKDKQKNLSYVRPTTDALIWYCMFVDIGTITEKNVDEFFWRMTVLRNVFGDHNKGGYHFYAQNLPDETQTKSWAEPTYDDVVAHIGLSTNASTRTRSQFMTKVAKMLTDTMNHKVDEAKIFDAQDCRKEFVQECRVKWEQSKVEESIAEDKKEVANG